MWAKGFLVVLVVLAGVVACAEETPSGEDPELPATLERVTGHRAVAYVLFFVLAALAVLVIFRGIRAR